MKTPLAPLQPDAIARTDPKEWRAGRHTAVWWWSVCGLVSICASVGEDTTATTDGMPRTLVHGSNARCRPP